MIEFVASLELGGKAKLRPQASRRRVYGRIAQHRLSGTATISLGLGIFGAMRRLSHCANFTAALSRIPTFSLKIPLHRHIACEELQAGQIGRIGVLSAG